MGSPARSKRTLLVLVAGIAVVGFLVGYRIRQQLALPRQEMAIALVASRKIPMGTRMKDPSKYFVVTALPPGTPLPRGRLTSFEQVRDCCVNKTLAVGAVIVADELIRPDLHEPNEVPPPARRSVEVPVWADAEVRRYLHNYPPTRVDLIVHVKGSDGPVLRRMLCNLEAQFVHWRDDEGSGQGVNTGMATFAVRPDDAERLQLAASLGEIWLRLADPGP